VGTIWGVHPTPNSSPLAAQQKMGWEEKHFSTIFTIYTMSQTGGSNSHLLQASRVIIYLLVFFTPLFFLPFTLESFEISKQTLLLLLTCAAGLLWLGSMLNEKRIILQSGWINVMPIFFLSAENCRF
jgi:hypothetical protein